MAAMLEAMRLVQDQPVEFWFVGPLQVTIPPEWLNDRKARWVDGVSRADTARFYRDADVFVLPTLSDGFAITQLEAQAWKLPLITSRFCGDVLRDGVNGTVLPDVAGEAIARALRSLIAEPGRLVAMSRHATGAATFGLDALGARMLQLAPHLTTQ
jgi:glycosyltransferase involved in cell wall biosynthesis